MMTSHTEIRRQPRAETFYRVFITVVYGFLLGVGLEKLADHLVTEKISTAYVLLFVGTLITSIHFWMVCVSSDNLSDSAYEILESGNRPALLNFLLVVDILFASSFAACLLTMFKSAVGHNLTFFLAFGGLATLSFGYDVSALCLAAFAALEAEERSSRNRMHTYVRTYGKWLCQDLLYIGAAWLMFRTALHKPGEFQILLSVGFISVALVGLTLDAIVLHAPLYRSIQQD